jgi:hypothetical protein
MKVLAVHRVIISSLSAGAAGFGVGRQAARQAGHDVVCWLAGGDASQRQAARRLEPDVVAFSCNYRERAEIVDLAKLTKVPGCSFSSGAWRFLRARNFWAWGRRILRSER